MILQKTVSKVRSISLSFQGLIVGIGMVFLALLSMDIGNMNFGFSFLPVIVIYYWPSAASYSWSLLCVFLFGLFYDMASANTLGMWALAFLVLFMVLDGAPRGRSGLGRALIEYALTVLFCLVVVLLIGWISMGRLPQVGSLLGNAVASIAVFPIAYWIRSMFVTISGSSGTLSMRE